MHKYRELAEDYPREINGPWREIPHSITDFQVPSANHRIFIFPMLTSLLPSSTHRDHFSHYVCVPRYAILKYSEK